MVEPRPANDNPLTGARRILVAESDRALRMTLVGLLEADGYEVSEAADGFELLQLLEASLDPSAESMSFDLVITDAYLPGKTGLHVFAMLGSNATVPPVVFTTSKGNEVGLRETKLSAGLVLLRKPIDIDELLALVHQYVTSGNT
jgi:two-component system, chemotaxis family, chemotaxis protein CheY